MATAVRRGGRGQQHEPVDAERGVALDAAPGERLDRARFELVHLLDDALHVALPGDHPLAGRRRLRVGDLAAERWIGAEPRDEDDRALGPAWLAAGLAADFPVREWMAKLGLVAAGLGITLVPSLAAPAVRPDVAIVALDRRDARPRRVLAATARGVTPAPAIRSFLAVLRAGARA